VSSRQRRLSIPAEPAKRLQLCLDLGPNSVDGWLASLVGSQLGVEEHDGELLDPANRQAILGNRRVDLTKLEYDLLSYLYQRRGVAVRRGALLETVCGYDDGGGSSVLEAAVRSLRHKLGEDADIIETVRGIGYRLRR
jgi:DNA-binding response OmpR family regulator